MSRKRAHAPVRSNFDGRSGISGAMVIEAEPAPAPGHCTAEEAAGVSCWATMLTPLIDRVAV